MTAIPSYTRVFGEILVSGDVEPIRLPPKSPNLNASAERFVRSIKEECLHRVVPLGEGHLRLIVHEYVEHYHRERNHQGLDNQLLQRPPPPVRSDADVQRGVVARIVTGPHDANRQDPHLPMRYDTGRPRAVIRFKISQPRTASLRCPAGLLARRPSPMMDL